MKNLLMNWIQIIFLCLCAVSAHAAVINVQPPQEGFANAVIEAAIAQAQPGDHIVLAAGEYRVSKAIRFQRSGTPEQPITMRAAAGAYVAIIGSRRLSGWQQHNEKIWKVAHPPRLVKGLYEDGVRLTHPRPKWGTRADPDLSELVAPGTWTQDEEFVYCWTRDGQSPDQHRIEASQNWVIVLDQQWLRLERLHLMYGQNIVCKIAADHCEVLHCEIAHCSNSVDNSYNAYFSGCSNSAFRHCLIHDSFYWGDHGSNSHVLSSINAGDHGPNVVDHCEIFNGGLGVGTKGAVRELVVAHSRIYDVANGVVISGERSGGPGAGKSDRGHYRIHHNYISDCGTGIEHFTRATQDNRVWNNVFERCTRGVLTRARSGNLPQDFLVLNNVFSDCATAIKMIKAYKGENAVDQFIKAGLKTQHNLFWQSQQHWVHPLNWSKNWYMHVDDEHSADYPALSKGCLVADPQLLADGYVADTSPTLNSGLAVPLPDYIKRPDAWHIGRGPRPSAASTAEQGLTLSIAGSTQTVVPDAAIAVQAHLINQGEALTFNGQQDALLTCHFRYRGGHADKQEVYRIRVQLPAITLEQGASLDLHTLPGWENPRNGKLGDTFHLRRDTRQWDQGYRLRATLRVIDRQQQTSAVVQELADLIRSQEVLRLAYSD